MTLNRARKRSASATSRSRRGKPAARTGRQARVRRGTPAAAAGSADLEPRRRPRQERARATVDAILEAAGKVIASEGYAGMTTNKVAARAGVSIGSLYQYFPNKQALLVALLEDHLAGLRPVIERSLEELADPSVPFAEALRHLFTGLLDLHRDSDPRLQRVLGEEVPHPPRVREHHRRNEAEYAARIADILRSRPDVQVDDPEVAAHVHVQAVGALSRWLAHDAPPGLDRDACVDEAVRLVTPSVQRPGS